MPPYVVNSPTHLVLSQKVKLLPGESYTVKDQDGSEVLRVDGAAISVSGNKTICDAQQGVELYRVKEALISLKDRQMIEDPETGDAVLTLQKKGFMLGAHTVIAYPGPNDDSEPLYTISGGILEKEFDIKVTDTDQVVASVRRDNFNFKNLFLYVYNAVTTQTNFSSSSSDISAFGHQLTRLTCLFSHVVYDIPWNAER
jgi:uncharacterized protein YxjI